MKDIKTLFMTAKSSMLPRDINAYSEAVHELIEKPTEYLSQLEYIISSNIGCSTLKEFVEKNGISISSFDTIMEHLEDGLEKANLKGAGKVYEESITMMKFFKERYQNCFRMYEYFEDKLQEGYLESYYDKVVIDANKRIYPGFLSRHGYVAVPDMLIKANKDGILESVLEIMTVNPILSTPVFMEWISEVSKDFSHNKKIIPIVENIKNKSLSTIVESVKNKRISVLRESVLTDNPDLEMVYEASDIAAIKDLISFKEYMVVCCENSDESIRLNEEVQSLYEELSSVVEENDTIYTETGNPVNTVAKEIAANMKELLKDMQQRCKTEVKAVVKEFNKSQGLFTKLQQPAVWVNFGDERGIPYSSLFLTGKVKKCMHDIKSSKGEFFDKIIFHLKLQKDASTEIYDRAAFDIYYSGISKALMPLVNSGKISFEKDPNTKNANYYYVTYTRSSTIPLWMSKSYITKGVDMSLVESVVEEDVSDNVIPMLPNSRNEGPIISKGIEAVGRLSNTDNKYTGNVPAYLNRNHNLDYGEKESILDDFKRPSANQKPVSGKPQPKATDPDADFSKPMTPEEREKAINNYYYYNYTNSNNTTANSHNQTNSHNQNDNSFDKTTNGNTTNSSHNNPLPQNNNQQPQSSGNPPQNVVLHGAAAEEDAGEESVNESGILGAIATVGAAIIGAPMVFMMGIVFTGILYMSISDINNKRAIKKAIENIVGKNAKDPKYYLTSAEKYLGKSISSGDKTKIIKLLYRGTGPEISIPSTINCGYGWAVANKSELRNMKKKEINANRLIFRGDVTDKVVIEKKNISMMIKLLNSISSENIKYALVEFTDDLPGDDSGGNWGPLEEVGLIPKGPDDMDEDDDINEIYDLADKALKEYSVVQVEAVIQAKKFLLKDRDPKAQMESVKPEELNIFGESMIPAKSETPIVEGGESEINFRYTYRIVKGDDGNFYRITFDIDGPGVINYKLHYPDATEETVKFVGTIPGKYLMKYGSDNYVSKGNKILSIQNVKTGENVDSIIASGAVPSDGDRSNSIGINQIEYRVGGLSPLSYKTTIPIYPMFGDVKTPYGGMKGLYIDPRFSNFANPFVKRRIDFSKPILYRDKYASLGVVLKDVLIGMERDLASYKNLSVTDIAKVINNKFTSHNLYSDYNIHPLPVNEYSNIMIMTSMFIKNCALNLDQEPWSSVPNFYMGLLIGFFGPPIGGTDKYININIMERLGSDKYKVDTNVFQNISDWFTLISNGIAQMVKVDRVKGREYMAQHETVKITIRDIFYNKLGHNIFESTFEELTESCKSYTEGLLDLFSSRKKHDSSNKSSMKSYNSKPSKPILDGFQFIPNSEGKMPLNMDEQLEDFLKNRYKSTELMILKQVKDVVEQYNLIGYSITSLTDRISSDMGENPPWGEESYGANRLFTPAFHDEYDYNDNIVFYGATGSDLLWEYFCPRGYHADPNAYQKLTPEDFHKFISTYNIPEEVVKGFIPHLNNISQWGRMEWGELALTILEGYTLPKLQESIDIPNVKLKACVDDTSWDGLLGVWVTFIDMQEAVDEFNKLNSTNNMSGTVKLLIPKPITEAVGDADNNKPKSDNPVGDFAQDLDRKLTAKQQEMKKGVQSVVNVGRVFTKPVKRTGQWISNMIMQWKDLDETKMKEKLADPHARSNIFKAVKTAIIGGSLFKAGILLNPVFLFLAITKKANSKGKEGRIRNEMIGEIKTEIEIIDMKISDADKAGDNQAKYQLVRLKNELNKKLLRVGSGTPSSRKKIAKTI